MKDLARRLRRHGTDAERLLWNRLRGRQLAGIKFRHQQVLGPYIVDFLCLEPKLVIEIDGGQHVEQAHQNEVLSDPDAVVGSIRAALIEIPLTPALSRRERELQRMLSREG
jgi:very-short-patch-repair endonuclease